MRVRRCPPSCDVLCAQTAACSRRRPAHGRYQKAYQDYARALRREYPRLQTKGDLFHPGDLRVALSQAMQLTFFFFLPSLLLSGFMFPFRGMPDWAQWLGEIFPLTHFLRVIRAVMLKGADLPAVAFETGILVLFIFVYAGFALLRFRRTLD